MTTYSKETHHSFDDQEKSASRPEPHLEKFFRDPIHELKTPLTVIQSSASLMCHYHLKLNDTDRARHIATLQQTRKILIEMMNSLQVWSIPGKSLHTALSRADSHSLLIEIGPDTRVLLQLLNEISTLDITNESILFPHLKKIIEVTDKIGQHIDDIELPSQTSFLQDADGSDHL